MTTTTTTAAARSALIAGMTGDEVLILARKAVATNDAAFLRDLYEAVRDSIPTRKRRVARWQRIEAEIGRMIAGETSEMRTRAERKAAKAAKPETPKAETTSTPTKTRSPFGQARQAEADQLAAYMHLSAGQARGILARTKNPTKRAALAKLAAWGN